MTRMMWIILPLCLSGVVFAEVPQTINHQGVIKVNGTAYDGTGQFKFAILNALGVNVWTNDGTNLVLNGVPSASETITVVDGVYSVLLGGSGPGYAMTAIPPGMFNESDRRLRIWFNDGTNGMQQLAPDHVLSSSPYSHRSALDPPIGSIIAWHKSLVGVPALPNGWAECNGQILSDVESPLSGSTMPNLNNAPVGYAGGRFLRGGTTSGVFQSASTVTEFTAGSDLTSSRLLNQSDGDFPGTPAGWSFVVVDGPLPQGGHEAAVRPVNMSVVWIMRVK